MGLGDIVVSLRVWNMVMGGKASVLWFYIFWGACIGSNPHRVPQSIIKEAVLWAVRTFICGVIAVLKREPLA